MENFRLPYLAVSPGDRLLAAAADDGWVVLYDAASGTARLRIRAVGAVQDIDFLPGGRALAIAAGSEVLIADADSPVEETPPSVVLHEAEQAAGVRLDGFELEPLVSDTPAPRSVAPPTP